MMHWRVGVLLGVLLCEKLCGMNSSSFGADVTKGQFIKLVFSLVIGTLVEWYDFTVYTQLSNILTELFFPPTNPVAAQFSFWAVYAVGYAARPVGAIIFGHIGDAHGRRLTLLISVLLITLSTLLIGCLPTYAQMGLAAPIIMALLRFIQGLALGGEYGSAITYLYEVSPVGFKGLMSALARSAASPGMILGILMCQAVLYGCTPAQLLLWGWRVPFLVTVFTAPLALYMRMHMPEPYEYLQDRQHMVLQRVASTAANKVAHSFVLQHTPQGASFTRQHTLRALSALRLSSLSAASSTDKATEAGAAGDQCAEEHNHSNNADDASGGAVRQLSARQLSARQLSVQLCRSVSITADGRLVQDVNPSKQQQQQQGHEMATTATESLKLARGLQPEVEVLSGVIKRHVPIAVLLKGHWQAVLTQFLLEACCGVTFYTVLTWAPAYLSSALHVPKTNSLWSMLIGLVLFGVVCPLAGHLVGDSKVPNVWVMMVAVILIAAVIMPTMVALHMSPAVGLWLMLPVMLALTGIAGGIGGTIGAQMYPPAVRASGFNLGYSLAMSLFGGLCPLVISALSVALRPATFAAGLVVIFSAVITLVGCMALIKAVPDTNAPCPAGKQVDFFKQQEQARREAQQMQQVVVMTDPISHDVYKDVAKDVTNQLS